MFTELEVLHFPYCSKKEEMVKRRKQAKTNGEGYNYDVKKNKTL